MFEPLPFNVSLSTERLGKPLLFIPEVDSTNRLLAELAAQETAEGTVLLTDYQRAGRGRRGRGWTTPPGSSLLLSVLLRPAHLTERHGLLPLVVGVAVARSVEQQVGLHPELKWPNDLLLNSRKCCGILIESVVQGGKSAAVIVGIGLNVNQEREHFAALPQATSLRAECGELLERGHLLAALLNEMEQCYRAFEAGWQPHEEWRKRATLLGQWLTVYPSEGGPWNARARDIAPDGSLIVEDVSGKQVHLRAADVSIRTTIEDHE